MDLPIWIFIIVGFIAQMIDGALGMAYGVSSNSFLLSLGLPPATASQTVHLAEVVTTAVSGAFHFHFGNVRKDLLLKLLVPGVIGAVAGAYLLVSIDGNVIKPYINMYLLVMGLIIIRKALVKNGAENHITTWIAPLGAVGGFFDAVGGGGWGPIVTTTLVARGNNPRKSIGSVNASEFFVTLAQSIVFLITLGLSDWHMVAGLLIGGVIAAPLAAYLANKLPARALMIMVGLLICFLSLRTLYQIYF